MGVVAILKLKPPLPLSKIYSKNQLKSIGKNTFFCAAIYSSKSTSKKWRIKLCSLRKIVGQRREIGGDRPSGLMLGMKTARGL